MLLLLLLLILMLMLIQEARTDRIRTRLDSNSYQLFFFFKKKGGIFKGILLCRSFGFVEVSKFVMGLTFVMGSSMNVYYYLAVAIAISNSNKQ